ncbi:MAG: cohesin domain-containing protein, partial [Halanaerobiales bacterium]
GSVTVEDGAVDPPLPPTLISAEAGIENVTLDWSNVNNADGYIVKYGTSSGNYTEEVDVASSTAYTVSGLSNITYYFAVSAYNVAGESINSNELNATPDIQITDFTLEIGTVPASQGETVTVPVNLINVPDGQINGADFRIGYDSSVVEIVSISPGAIIPRPNIDFYSYNNTEQDYISFLFADEEQQGNNMIHEDGVFANIEVRILTGAPVGLSEIIVRSIGAFADYELNVYDVDSIDGGVNIE